MYDSPRIYDDPGNFSLPQAGGVENVVNYSTAKALVSNAATVFVGIVTLVLHRALE